MIAPDRATLYARADARFDEMVAMGALDEVAALKARELDAALPAMRALGVPELMAHLAGTLSLGDAIERAKLETHRYIKRQSTWIKRNMKSWNYNPQQ